MFDYYMVESDKKTFKGRLIKSNSWAPSQPAGCSECGVNITDGEFYSRRTYDEKEYGDERRWTVIDESFYCADCGKKIQVIEAL